MAGKRSYVAVVRRGDTVDNKFTVRGSAEIETLAQRLREKTAQKAVNFFVVRPDAERYAPSTYMLTRLLDGKSYIELGLNHDETDPLNDKLPFPGGWGPLFGKAGYCMVVVAPGGTRLVRCVQSLSKEFGINLPDLNAFSFQRMGHGYFLDLRQRTLVEI